MNDTDCDMNTSELTNTHYVVIIAVPIGLVLIGSVGNVATFLVFRRKEYKMNIMANMFRYQSILDLIFLWTSVLPFAVKGAFGFDITIISVESCFVVYFWVDALQMLSNWLLVVITLARLIHLKWPLKSKVICSQFNYLMLLVATHILVIGYHGGSVLVAYQRLLASDYSEDSGCYHHISRPDVQNQNEKVGFLFMSFIGPAVMLIIFNGMMIVELRAWKKRQALLFKKIDKGVEAKSSEMPGPSSTNFYISNTTNSNIRNAPPRWSSDTLTDNLSLGTPMMTLVSHHIASTYDRTESHKGDFLSMSNEFLYKYRAVRHKPSPSVCGSQKDISSGNKNARYSYPGNVQLEGISETGECNINYNNMNETIEMKPYKGMIEREQVQDRSVSTPGRLSLKSWISEAMSNGVDMGFEDDRNLGLSSALNIKENTPHNKRISRRQSLANTNNARIYILTRMIIVASAIFITLNSPFWVFHLFIYKNVAQQIDCKLLYMLIDILYLLRSSNNSLNFIFYCAIGSKFRKDFISLFKCGAGSEGTDGI